MPSSMFRFMLKSDTSGIDRVERRLYRSSAAMTENIARSIKNDIQSHWSPSSPSPVGQPPAKVSGDLDKSIRVQARRSGKFARQENATAWTVQAGHNRPTRDHPDGVIYARLLEDSYDRPYMRPAMKRAEQRFLLESRRL